ncbi:UNVERIFIED_CONTAM: hypothetical protein Slati_2209100 [Sesamum latifolium]|uniref:Uncharacterized protein n=1 Tax=Sesamum latifolium TaxID=2727402 RepID=A0AAW2WSU1_9LAMI
MGGRVGVGAGMKSAGATFVGGREYAIPPSRKIAGSCTAACAVFGFTATSFDRGVSPPSIGASTTVETGRGASNTLGGSPSTTATE